VKKRTFGGRYGQEKKPNQKAHIFVLKKGMEYRACPDFARAG